MPPTNISVTVTGEFSLDDIDTALKAHFVGKVIRVDRGNSENGNHSKKSSGETKDSDSPKEIVVSYSPTALSSIVVDLRLENMKQLFLSDYPSLLFRQKIF